MAGADGKLFRDVQRTEKGLQAYLKEKSFTFPNIAHFLAQYRSACSDLILEDFECSVSNDIESKLWDSHGKVNNRFRKELKNLREHASRKNPVEQRKTAKHFLDFIKSSQRFYRGHIQRLASRFGGIPELEAVVNRLSLSTLSADETTQASGPLSHSVLLSCHRALVQLGDLSRWRETELVIKDRDWGPAIGYYDLAKVIYPNSGASHNQLAVIALADCSHLRATYHLYRALAVEEPHPSAKGNLEVEFRKVTEAQDKDNAATKSTVLETSASVEDMVTCFMRLHAQCFKSSNVPAYENNQNEMMCQLSVDVKERSSESILNKILLINIAAEYFAGVRLKGDASSTDMLQSYFNFLRLNVVTFFTLLKILVVELERDTAEYLQSSGTGSRYEKLTIVTRRMLPGLRNYSSWLASNVMILAAGVGDITLNIQVKEFWTIYAKALTLLVLTFPVCDLPPPVEYLLEEDEETLAFKPLDNEHAQRRYYNEVTGLRKPKWHDRNIQRQHPNIEMLCRIRDFLTDGMVIQSQENVPIRLEGVTFVYVEDCFPSHEAHEEITHISETTFPHALEDDRDDASQADLTSAAMDLASERMVDKLVDSETAYDDVEEPSKPRVFLALMNGNENETSYGLFGTSTASELGGHADMPDQPSIAPQPLLPSIYNSPFAPQPGERTPKSRPSTAKRSTPSHSRHSSQMIFPFQRPSGHILDSSQISMPEPTQSGPRMNIGHLKQFSINAGFPAKTNYTTGESSPFIYGNDGYSALDACHFISPTVDFGCSGSVNRTTNFQTPPNGQGDG